jgi:hypothetical protein
VQRGRSGRGRLSALIGYAVRTESGHAVEDSAADSGFDLRSGQLPVMPMVAEYALAAYMAVSALDLVP